MATAVLGSSVDVLAGGADLRFPHHAYQAAMAEAATGVQPFARARLSVGTVHLAGEKMAKSTGNLVLVADLLHTSRPADVRMLLLNRRWDQDWDLHDADLEQAASSVDALHEASARVGDEADADRQVLSALLDDLDVPRALQAALDAGGSAARLLSRALLLH